MKLKEILSYLDKIFQYSTFEEAYGSNGLQVEGKQEIKKIAFSVDANSTTIQKTIELNCDMLISHHGLFWPSIKSITGPMKNKIKLLLDNNISLIGMHLPLDKHPEIGNNVELSKLFNAKIIGEIDSIGCFAELKEEKSILEITETLNSKLNTSSKVFDFSQGKAKRIAFCSGGGGSHFYSILGKDCDLFVTGELKYELIENAKENNISLIEAGHYATETLGIKALMQKMQKELKIDVTYIDAKVDY